MNQLIMQYKLCSQDRIRTCMDDCFAYTLRLYYDLSFSHFRYNTCYNRHTQQSKSTYVCWWLAFYQFRHLTMLLSFQAVRLLLLVVRTCTDHVVADFKVCRFTIKLPDYLKLAISICLRRSFPYAGKILF